MGSSVFYKKLGLGPVEVARRVGINRNSVPQILQKYEETKTVHDKSKSGRKRKLSGKEEKQIIRKAKKHKSAAQIAKELDDKVSPRTVQRTLKKLGLFYGKVKKIERLFPIHKAKRLAYADEKKDYDWERVMFSDEKTFEIFVGEDYAWQEIGKREVREYVTHAPKLHVWAGVGSYVRTKLYFFEKNLDQYLYQSILKKCLKESELIYAPKAPRRVVKKWIFLQDGNRAHTAKSTQAFLDDFMDNRLTDHPPKSPDLNPIEDIWSYLDRKVKEAKVTSIGQLKKVLKKEWKNLPWDYIRSSVNSMPKRLRQLKECGGNRLDY